MSDEWEDLDWEFLEEEALDMIELTEAVSCALENPETCEACQ